MMTLQWALIGFGLLAAVHAICTANHMTRKVPISVGFEVIVMFGFAVGTLAASWNGEVPRAAAFLIIALIAKMVSIVDLLCRGYPISYSLLNYQIHRRSSDR